MSSNIASDVYAISLLSLQLERFTPRYDARFLPLSLKKVYAYISKSQMQRNPQKLLQPVTNM